MMAAYSYKAINSDGKVVKGTIRGLDVSAVREYVFSSGLYLLKLKKTGRLSGYITKACTFDKIWTGDVIEFSRSMALMLRSGVPVVQAMAEIASSTEKCAFSDALDEIRRDIVGGASFSGAFEKQKAIFPHILIRLSRIGEETGRLDRSFDDAAAHLEKMEELYSTMKKALLYPVFAVVFTLAALLFWLIFVLPNVMHLFNAMNITMPLPTRILLASSNFCRGYWYVLVALPLFFVAAITLLKRKRATRYYLDMLLLKMPIIRHVSYNWLLTFFCEQLRILTGAGIPINRSMGVIHGAVNNEVMKRAVSRIGDEIESGGSISEALKREGVFPGLMVRLVAVGETSGTLESQFTYLSEFYGLRLNDFSQKLGKMLEPIIISVVGVMFALIIMGLLLPVYDLVAKVR